MLHTKLMELNINGINQKDQTYNLDEYIDIDKIEQRIRITGFVNPIIAEITNSGFRVISGFARLKAMIQIGENTIPAVVIEQQLSFKEAFTLALQQKFENGMLGPVEISLVIHHLENGGISVNEIIKYFLPQMGFGRNPKVYELYKDIYKLEKEWQQLLTDDLLSIDMAAELVLADSDARNAFLRFVKNLRIGKNRQKEFWSIIQDIAKIKKTTVQEYLFQPDLQNITDDELLSPAQKSDRVKQVLWRARYPQYTATEARFDEIIKQAKLSPDMTIQHPPFFDGNRFTVYFNFTNNEEFQQHVERLLSIKERNLLEALMNLI